MPFFHSLNFTANGITTLSLIFGLVSIVFLYKSLPIPAVACYIISYFFDVMDGRYARRYKMVSKLGDYYDHIKDWVVNISYAIVLVMRNKHKMSRRGWIILASVFLVLFGLQVLYFAAQERYHDKLGNSPTLSWLSGLVKTKEEALNILKWDRFFGCGTFILTVCVVTLYLETL